MFEALLTNGFNNFFKRAVFGIAFEISNKDSYENDRLFIVSLILNSFQMTHDNIEFYHLVRLCFLDVFRVQINVNTVCYSITKYYWYFHNQSIEEHDFYQYPCFLTCVVIKTYSIWARHYQDD